MDFSVADLCDGREAQIQVFHPHFASFGGKKSVFGAIRTVKVDQNPKGVESVLLESGNNCILVVDADANPKGAVVGDTLAQIAVDNGWQGIIVNGYIRDTAILKNMNIGIWALGTCPRRGTLDKSAEKDIEISFGGMSIKPGHYIYADDDGIIVSEVCIHENN